MADGTPALQASFQPAALAFGPDGQMYVAAYKQVLRLTPDGTFVTVLGEEANEDAGIAGIGGPAADASADGADGVAVNSAENVYVSGANTKAILMESEIYPKGSCTSWVICIREARAAW